MRLRDQMMSSRRLAGGIRRYHAWPVVQSQTVAEHTWQVMRVYHELFGSPPAEVWEAILWHDVLEMHTGDIPFQVKQRYPGVKKALDEAEVHAAREMGVVWPEITQVQRKSIKLCDILEMWEFGKQEMAMGNKLAGPIVTGTILVASKIAEELALADKVNRWMESHHT
jgi:hypothetical protein